MANAGESLEELSLSSLWTDVDKNLSLPPPKAGGYHSPGQLPSQLVAQNHDILPLVFEQLKDLYTADTKKWKKPFAPLLVINKSFFQCAADMLWDAMDSLEPAFKFLPWFRPQYSGIGMHAYAGSANWARLTLYAPRIKRLVLADTSNIEISTAWFMELFTLPGRPHPLFPALQTVQLPPKVLSGPPIAFLLVGPTLRSLYMEDGENQPSPHALSILPTLPISSPNIRNFKYDGELSWGFLSQLGKVISITSLQLASSHEGDRQALRELRAMPRLESLTLSVPSFTLTITPLFMKTELPQYGHLQTLKSLEVTAKEHQQCLIARAISPRDLRELTLTFIKVQYFMPLPLCLALYLDANEALSRLVIKFTNPRHELLQPIPRPRPEDWPSTAGATARFHAALRKSKRIESFFIYDIPLDLGIATSASLLIGLPCWSLLTHLCFRLAAYDLVQLEALGNSATRNSVSTFRFPGLSLLASEFWGHCPKLEELEYHFDRDLVETEGLTESLAACENRFAGNVGEYPIGHHRLRKLCINTGSTRTPQELKVLQLSVSRKIQIATFLVRLFPTLDVVTGSASEVWSEIDAWVKSYQNLRTHFTAQVDTVLAGY